MNETMLDESELVVVFEELGWMGLCDEFGCGGCRKVDVEYFILILLTAHSVISRLLDIVMS